MRILITFRDVKPGQKFTTSYLPEGIVFEKLSEDHSRKNFLPALITENNNAELSMLSVGKIFTFDNDDEVELVEE
jgi:hypothetical protein